MQEKEEKKRAAKAKEAEDEARLMNDYATYYRIGALNQGGGSPIRNKQGEIVAQHNPFSSQSQHNGGVEEMQVEYANRQRDNPNMVTSYGQQFGAGATQAKRAEAGDITDFKPFTVTYSPKKQEIQHMKPSNMFEDITEEEFNKREQDKKSY